MSDQILLCRALRHNLSAGLTLRDVFRQQARRGSAAVRPIADQICQDLQEGESLEGALDKVKDRFPPLFLALAEVGEESGNLPEVFGELEKYLVLQQRLRRQFIGQIIWPALQLFAAIWVIAGMIFILGILSPPGSAPFDPLGMGLVGTAGAISWLVFCFGSLAILAAAYYVATRMLQQKGVVDELLLRLPIIGPCLTALALTRFCVGLQLTMETGMSITAAMRLSLRGTGNGAFEARTPTAVAALRQGDDLTHALTRCGLFPGDFLDIVAVGEEGGRMTETLRHQAEYYSEEASRRMTILTRAASWGVWMVVAGMIIFLIFRIFMSYIGLLNSIG